VVADALHRAGSYAGALALAAGIGALLLVAALARFGALIGPALGVGGATYLGAVFIHGHRVDPTAPLVALMLILCGELTAWSVDGRVRIDADEKFVWRRAAAVGALALLGLAAATLAVALSTVPPGHGVVWTAAGAAAAVAAVGAVVNFTWRHSK
jgi:hypothetical protein